MALLSQGDVYDRAVERWMARFEAEMTTDQREVGLIRASLVALKGVDGTAVVGADTLMQLMDIRGLEFARDALKAWIVPHDW